MKRVMAGCAVVWLCMVAVPAWAMLMTGEVIRVMDGDTVEVLVKKNKVRIRLAEIDAPEKAQAFGERSRQLLNDLVYRKEVIVIDHGKDRYGRVLGTLIYRDDNVNKIMVKQGMAWVYRQYSKDKEMVVLENEARLHRRGLWADAHPVAPWEFRKQRQRQRQQKREQQRLHK